MKPDLLKGIYAVGFENPSFIQKKAIQAMMTKKDLRAQAQSGTGKTGAFVVGALQQLDHTRRATQVLVLTPTREIAMQNATKLKEIGTYMQIKTHIVSGGTPVSIDREMIRTSPHVVVGTPGRINHMIKEKSLILDQVTHFILDEADEMLKAGFKEEVKEIFKSLVADKLQCSLFSATYSEADLSVISDFLEDPIVIDLRRDEQTLSGIEQAYVNIGPSEAVGYSPILRRKELTLKVATLVDIFQKGAFNQMIIFVNRKDDATLAHELLQDIGFPCDLITSDLVPLAREKALADFKTGTTRILVSSGICKRGIDVQSLSMVVCFDVPRPEDKNDFIHRVGRSGRYGRKGFALHILTEQELTELKVIADHFQSTIDPFVESQLPGYKMKQ